MGWFDRFLKSSRDAARTDVPMRVLRRRIVIFLAPLFLSAALRAQ
jgi:hypothetical protein